MPSVSGSFALLVSVRCIITLAVISLAARVHISSEDEAVRHSKIGYQARTRSSRSTLRPTSKLASQYKLTNARSLLQVSAPTFRDICPSTSGDSLLKHYEPCIEYIKVDWLSKRLSVANQHLRDEWTRYTDQAGAEATQYFFNRSDVEDWKYLMDAQFVADGSMETRKDTIAFGNVRIVSITLNGQDLLVISKIVTSLKSAGEAFPQAFGNNNTLGEGGFGRVYLARDVATKELVAIKSVHKEMLSDFSFVEVEVARQGFGYNIGLNDVFYTTRNNQIERLDLVYPYVNGGDLYSFINACPPQVEIGTIRRILAQLAWGLLTLHRHGIVHRDLKLENVMLRRVTNEVVLIDHGLSVTNCSDSQDCSHEATGSMEYASPDVLFMRGYSYEVDWYSFGIVAFALATRSYPYGSPDDLQALAKNAARGKPDLKSTITRKEVGLPEGQGDQVLTDFRELINLTISRAGRSALKAARRSGGLDKLSGIIQDLPFWGPTDGFFGWGERSRLALYMDTEFPGHKELGYRQASAAKCHEQQLT